MPPVLSLLLGATGLFLIVVSVWLRWQSARVGEWPQTEGVILASALVADPHDAGSSFQLQYSYQVGGVSYTSERLTFNPTSDSVDAKAARLAAYPVGRQVTVYYDPARPERAVLEREPSAGWLAAVATGGILLAVAFFFGR